MSDDRDGQFDALQDAEGVWKVYMYQAGTPGYSNSQTWVPVSGPMTRSAAQAEAAARNAARARRESLGDGLVPAWAPTPRLRRRQRWSARGLISKLNNR